ncbi:hypothetical protein ACFW4K_07725 [Nocardiopsis alba]|uniref:hypothetical protein n=1 Tax=Nocardiopsis alba TaxID=53437 RepID=UPI003670F045
MTGENTTRLYARYAIDLAAITDLRFDTDGGRWRFAVLGSLRGSPTSLMPDRLSREGRLGGPKLRRPPR